MSGHGGEDGAAVALEEGRDAANWGDLSTPILEHIFDFILRAPMPHPEYLPGKLSNWSALYRTCKQWRLAVISTSVGVCLPKQVDKRTQAWLRKCRIRGLELHDPDHTPEDTYSTLLTSPEMLRNSGDALQSIVDVPFNGKWRPADFKNLSQLVTRRAVTSKHPPCFDMTAVATMKNLKVLVLGSGFNSLRNLECLPDGCKTLVLSCPGHPHDSHLQINQWPPGKSLDWLSLSAHTMQLDLKQLQGHVRQLNIHTAYLFLEAPELSEMRDAPEGERRMAADAMLEELVEGVVRDSALGELQLNCEVVMVGSRPQIEAVNAGMLSGTLPVDVQEFYVDMCNHQVEAVLEAAAAEAEGREGATDRVQLMSMHHGPELEVTLIRFKEGENNALALRLDLPGVDMEQEIDKLLQQLADVAAAEHAAGNKQPSAEQQIMGEPPSKTKIPSYRCVAFPTWSNLTTEPEAAATGGSIAAAVPTHAPVSKAMPRGFESNKHLGRRKADNSSIPSTNGAGSSSADADASTVSTSAASAQGASSAIMARAKHQVQMQTRLLSSAAFVEGSIGTLYEVTGLLLPPNPRPMRSLLSPFLNLSALFATTMEELHPHKDVLPMPLQELYLTAGTPRQRFHSSAITNLTELRRVSLRGFSSYDLGDMPAVRPGFGLALMDPCPSRTQPLGSSAVDKLMPKGLIVDITINISSELPPPTPSASTPADAATPTTPTAEAVPASATSAASPATAPSPAPPASSALPLPSASLLASASQRTESADLQLQPASPSSSHATMAPSSLPAAVSEAGPSSTSAAATTSSSPPAAAVAAAAPLRPLEVDITAWAPLGQGLHVHCDAGVVLHAPKCRTLKQMMSELASAGVDHVVVVVGMPPNMASPNAFLFDGLATLQVKLRNGRLVDGMEWVMLVAEGECPQWSVHWMVDGQPAGAGPTMNGGPALHMDIPPGFGQGGEAGEGEEEGEGEQEESEGEEAEAATPPSVCISFARNTRGKPGH